MTWEFGSAPGFVGLTGAATTIFDGDALAGTVREVIQNSLDAGVGHRVSVGISLNSYRVSDMPGIVSASEPLKRAYETWLKRRKRKDSDFDSVPEEELDATVLFYREAIKLTEAKEITVLGFHDWGTSGLTGPMREKEGVAPGPFVALVHNNGDNHKSSETSLGSFGQGSKAPIALSQLRSVFYLTRIEEESGTEERFIGKALWSSAYSGLDNPPFTSETGFFSADSKTLHPFTGADVPAWARDTRNHYSDGTGTSVYIPAPNGLDNKEDYEDRIFTTVLLNFYFAIETGRLEIVFPDGRKIDDSNLRELAKQSGILEREDLDAEKFQALQTLYFATEDRRGMLESEKFGRYFYAIRVGDEISGRAVSLTRDPGMFISAQPPGLLRFNAMQNFNLFICVLGERGLSVLRAAEPPTHDRLEFDRIKSKQKRDAFKSDYESFANEIRQLARKFAELQTSGRFEVQGLADVLGGLSEEDQDDVRVEFPAKLKIVEGKKRSKRESVGIGAGSPGPSGAGGSGGRGGGNGPGGGDGDGSGTGTRGAKLKQTTQLLLEVDSKSGRHTVYFTVEKPSEAVSVKLFASGENQREPIRFSKSEEGPLMGEVERTSWESIGNGQHRFKVSFFPQAAVDSVEAWLEMKNEGSK